MRCAWCRFGELCPLLAMRGFLLGLKGGVCRACVQGVLLYGGGAWAVGIEDVNELERAEGSMMRMLCDVSLEDRKSSQVIASWLGMDPVSILVKRGRLRWFEHVGRGDGEDWVSACGDVGVDDARDGGRGGRAWMGYVVDDIGTFGLGKGGAQGREMWRDVFAGNRLTRTCATQPNTR